MKTDNSYFEEKVQLRLSCIKKGITVLDCYAGKGILWGEVKKRTTQKIDITSIEKEPGKNKRALPGDNIKYLKSLDLNKFNVIDLDAYGIPFNQLEIIFKRQYKGIVIVTAIQSMLGKLPTGMLIELGYTKKMINKIPTLFNNKGIDKLKNYLYLHGVQSIEGYFIGRKNYFKFNLK